MKAFNIRLSWKKHIYFRKINASNKVLEIKMNKELIQVTESNSNDHFMFFLTR